MSTSATAPAPRPRPSWRNSADQAAKPGAPSTSPPPASEEMSPMPPSSTVAANGHDEETFTVSSGKGKSPDVEPGVYALVVTNVRRETGPNPFEPGSERTSYIFHLAIADAVEEGEFLWFAGTSLKSKRLTDILAALKLSIATSFTKTQVVGRKCQGNVILSDKGYTRLSQVFPAA